MRGSQFFGGDKRHSSQMMDSDREPICHASREMIRRIAKIIGLALLAALILLLCWPLRKHPLKVEPQPIRDFTAAQAAARRMVDTEPDAVGEKCRTLFFDHGQPTRDVYVLLHGLSNCPAQFRDFGRQLYERGANVLIPRTPRHGFSDRMTDELSELTAQEMITSASHAIDVAQGLGERVIVLGLSVNGVTAAWLAQERSDIDLAVPVAPFFAPHGLPPWGIAPVARLLIRVPNEFVWWDRDAKEDLLGSPFSYPRFATHAIGQVMALGLDVCKRAESSPPAAKRILLIAAPADPAISVPRMEELAGIWAPRANARLFPAEWNLPHDCIDPDQPGGRVDLAYPQLIQWMDEALE